MQTTWSLNSAVIVNDTTDDKIIISPRIIFASLQGIEDSTGLGAYTIGTQTFNSGLHYAINTGYLSAQSVTSTAFFASNTFKANCSHDLGIVYYDKYNRSGFVNKLGSFFVEPFGASARSGNNGAASVQINITSTAPSWAERYQIVYPGMNSYDNVFQYTSGGAYYNASNDNDKRVYVSLKTLSHYRENKGALRDYSFTEGDKLRVISYDAANGTTSATENKTYATANDGTVIEFNVVGVINMPQDGITFESTTHTPSTIEPPFEGDFLILEAPAVAAGLETVVNNSTAILKYTGFDWFSISGATYPTEVSATTQENWWGKKCLFEIVTPKKTVSEKIYYEIGDSRRVGTYKTAGVTNHGPAFILSCGDLHFTPVSCNSPYRTSNQNLHLDGSDGNWNE